MVSEIVLNGAGAMMQAGCLGSASCDDGEPCTFDYCLANGCQSVFSDFGDVAGPGGTCGPNGTVDLLDILGILDGFQGEFADGCGEHNLDLAGPGGSCGPDGGIDLVDILAVLDAFANVSSCCEFPLGACCIDVVCHDEMAALECTNSGGFYQGDDTNCATTECVSPEKEFEVQCDVSIPDNNAGGVSCELTVPDDGTTVGDLDVGLYITHTWQGDLEVILEHVDTGTTATLINRVGVGPCSTTFGYDANDFGSQDNPLWLDDEAVTPINPYDGCPDATQRSAGVALPSKDMGLVDMRGASSRRPGGTSAAGAGTGINGYAGPASPETPLSVFDGLNKAGVWRVTVIDHAAQDLGVLRNFVLAFYNEPGQ